MEVTRRHHPLYGRELEVLQANKVVLTIRQPDGSTMKILREWTNAGSATVVQAWTGSVFTVEGVRELMRIVEGLRHRGEMLDA